MHAVLDFLLSGLERGERLLTVLDSSSQQLVGTMIDHLGEAVGDNRHRSLPAESFAESAPVDAEWVVETIRRAASGWRGRSSPRPVRVVVDMHYLLVSLRSRREISGLSGRLSELTAELPVICLCLLFVEHVPRTGLQTFLGSFGRIVPTDSLLFGRGEEPVGDPRDRSGELDAALDRLLLSDEIVVEKAVTGGEGRLADIDARAFLHVAGDAILILDRELCVEYASPSFTAQLQGRRRVQRGLPLATYFSSKAYRSVDAAFRKLAADSLSQRTPITGIVTLPVTNGSGERVFEASVTPLSAYGRLIGFVCVLRGVVDEGQAGRVWTPIDQGAAARRLPRGGRAAGGSVQAWRVLPRHVVEGRSLTVREAEILEHTINGSSTEEIADRLAIAMVTVKKHRSNAYRKLGVRDRFELFRLADTTR
jgi:DNA-binding CsgD family transcriptional regulator/PAS domain-containing protein